ncbi:MAG: hypothetical protein RR140_02135 [Clostridia bacterium]
MKKVKAVATIFAIMMGVFAMTYGVLSATKIEVNVSTKLSFTATEVFGDVKIGILNAYRKLTSGNHSFAKLGKSDGDVKQNTAIWYPWANANGGQSIAGTKIVGNANAEFTGNVNNGIWNFPAVSNLCTEGLFFNPEASTLANTSIIVCLKITNNSESGPIIFFQPTQLMNAGSPAKIKAEIFEIELNNLGTKINEAVNSGGNGYYISILSGETVDIIIEYTPISLNASFGTIDGNAIILSPTLKLQSMYDILPTMSSVTNITFSQRTIDFHENFVNLCKNMLFN